MKVDVVITWYRKVEWWPVVLWGLMSNKDNINKVIIAEDEESAWQAEALGSGLTIQHLKWPHEGWGASRVLNKAVEYVTTDVFCHIDGDMALCPGSLATSLRYVNDVGLLGAKVYNVTPDARLEQVSRKDNGRAIELTLVASQVVPDSRDFGFRSPLPLNLRHGHFLASLAKWRTLGGHVYDEFKVDGEDAYYSQDYTLAARWMMAFGRNDFAYGGGGAYHLGGTYKATHEAECDENKGRVRAYLEKYVAQYPDEGPVTWNEGVVLDKTIKGGNWLSVPPNYVEVQREYNAKHSDGSFEGDEDDRWGDIVALIGCHGANKGQRVLDVGCRGGVSLVELAKAGFVASGVDVVPEFIEHAKGRGVDAQVADVHKLPFDDTHFDWVTCLGTFEHFYDVRKAASEMGRVAKCGIYVTCAIGTPLGSDYAGCNNPAVWRALLEEHTGMKTVHEGVYKGSVCDSVELVLVR